MFNYHGNFQDISQRNGFDKKMSKLAIESSLGAVRRILLDFDTPIGDEDVGFFPLENSEG